MSWLCSADTAQGFVEPADGQSEYVSNSGYHLADSGGLGGCHVDRPSDVDDRRLSTGVKEFNSHVVAIGGDGGTGQMGGYVGHWDFSS
jgi:hypothetical protein